MLRKKLFVLKQNTDGTISYQAECGICNRILYILGQRNVDFYVVCVYVSLVFSSWGLYHIKEVHMTATFVLSVYK